MKINIQTLFLLFLILANSGCAAAWFGAGAATGAVVHEAVDDDEKVVIVEKEKG
ncbi:MAG: hypothetical protein HYZ84_03435 [Candidatus Omnitrophica bacterium]|nr:hypothetical protein [Candidatus Omnitrophota bacterium]